MPHHLPPAGPGADEDNRRRLLRRERLNSIASAATLHGVNRDLQCNNSEEEKEDYDDVNKQKEEFLKEVLWACAMSSIGGQIQGASDSVTI